MSHSDAQSQEEMGMSDAEMVRLALHEQSFFAYIIERYEAKLNRYLRRLGIQSPEDRADVLQDVFIKVYRNLRGYDPELPFSSWIYRIAHNEAVSWHRKRSARPEGHMVLDSDDILRFQRSSDESSEAQAEAQLSAEQLACALARLDDRYRAVLVLRYFEEKDYREISDILCIPVGSVGTLLHRGKKALRRELNRTHVRT
jgi:RNA polymerase sigma-70 factor (ECF subfamily)